MNHQESTELQIPYFEGITEYLSEYNIELLYQLEHLFNDVDYNNHQDDLTMLYNTYPDSTGGDRANLVMSSYRENIDQLLAMQGIFLSDPYGAKLSELITIIKGCNLLGTKPLKELLVFEYIDTNVTADEFFATIISSITDLEIHQVLLLVKSINESTIEYLHNNVPIPHNDIINENKSRERFKKYLPLITHQGIVVENIKVINTFDYSPFLFADAIREDLLDLSETETANEIVLMLLGSHTPDELLRITALEVIDKLVEDLKTKLLLNGLVSKALTHYEALQ